MRYLTLAFLTLAACSQTHPVPLKTKAEQMCRDSHEVNMATVGLMNTQGWRYQGPLYNNGINCTVTLWACYDSGASCAK